MSDLADLGQLASRTSSAEDVTTQLIDVDAQIKVQEASVQRVRQLLTRAQSIRDIMAIESELANRQAQLDSLSQQQAYLENQTSLATIQVSIERQPDAVVEKEKDDRTGFLGGLGAGWDGLRATVVAVLTVVGAVLPFAVVALLVGVPVWLLVRRLRRSPLAPQSDASQAST
jgi:phage-related minor tail protein